MAIAIPFKKASTTTSQTVIIFSQVSAAKIKASTIITD